MAAPAETSTSQGLAGLTILVVGGYVLWIMWAMEHADYNTWGGLLVAPVLVAISLPLISRAAGRERDPRLARLIIFALVLKLAASMARYAVAFDLYDGVADAGVYHQWGEKIAVELRQLHFGFDLGAKQFVGTGFTRLLTGIIYVFIGPTRIGGFLVFSWFGFWGLYLFYRAFAIAVPEGDSYRYAKLVLLLPSLLFWPSGIGKEAWMTLTLGVAAYGAAKVYTRQRGGYPLLALGLAGTALARPHITAILVAGVVFGYLLRPRPDNATVMTPVYKAAGLAVMAGLVFVVLGQAERFLGVDSFNQESVGQVIEGTSELTDEGGSTFEAKGVHSPKDLPLAALTVLFRPLPTEAHNAQAMVASVEGVFLLLLMVKSRRRFLTARRLIRRRPYISFALVYLLLFVYAFSNFNNFGIMTRQRVQVFPLMLVLLALPLPEALRTADAARSYPPRRSLVPLGRP
jgi:hypothetical protein